MADSSSQSVDVPLGAVKPLHLLAHPVGRQPFARSCQVPIKIGQQPSVRFRHSFAKIRNLTDFPQQPHPGAGIGPLKYLWRTR